jgi:hypothetical protein
MKNKYLPIALPDYVVESLNTLAKAHPPNAGKTEATRKAFGFTDQHAPLLITKNGALAPYLWSSDDGDVSVALNYHAAGLCAPGSFKLVETDPSYNVELPPVDEYRKEHGLPPLEDEPNITIKTE